MEGTERMQILELRAKLNLMGYGDLAGGANPQSGDLVAKLLDDLIQAVDGYKVLSEDFQKQNEEILLLRESKGPAALTMDNKPVSELELQRLKALVTQLDLERDGLQQHVDDLTVKLDTQQKELESVRSENVQMLQDCKQLARAQEEGESRIAGKEREIYSLKTQVERLSQQKSQFESENKALSHQLTLCKQDVDGLVKQNQLLSRDLASKRSELDQTKREMHEALAKYTYNEQLVSHQEKDKKDIMQAYQRLGKEHTILQATIHQLQIDNAALKEDISVRDGARKKMEDYIDEIEQENNRYVRDLRAFERQSEDMSRAIKDLETKLSAYENDKIKMNSDSLAAQQVVRQLQVTLETSSREYACLAKDHDMALRRVDEEKREKEVVISQLKKQTEMYMALEALLKQERMQHIEQIALLQTTRHGDNPLSHTPSTFTLSGFPISHSHAHGHAVSPHMGDMAFPAGYPTGFPAIPAPIAASTPTPAAGRNDGSPTSAGSSAPSPSSPATLSPSTSPAGSLSSPGSPLSPSHSPSHHVAAQAENETPAGAKAPMNPKASLSLHRSAIPLPTRAGGTKRAPATIPRAQAEERAVKAGMAVTHNTPHTTNFAASPSVFNVSSMSAGSAWGEEVLETVRMQTEVIKALEAEKQRYMQLTHRYENEMQGSEERVQELKDKMAELQETVRKHEESLNGSFIGALG